MEPHRHQNSHWIMESLRLEKPPRSLSPSRSVGTFGAEAAASPSVRTFSLTNPKGKTTSSSIVFPQELFSSGQSCPCWVSSKPIQRQPHLFSAGFLHPCKKQRHSPLAPHPLGSSKLWCQTSQGVLLRLVPAQHRRVFPGEKKEFRLPSAGTDEHERVTFAPFSLAVSAQWDLWEMKTTTERSLDERPGL